MVAIFSMFYGKAWVGFCLSTGKRFFLGGLILKPTERAYVLLKSSTRDFQNSPLLKRPTCFHVTISGNFYIFSTLTLKLIFSKTKTLFKKLKYWCLIERIKIENASFPYKTAISEVNVKTNRMVSTKWIYQEGTEFCL